MGELIRSICVNGSIIFVTQKILKLLDKKDFANIIAMSGFCVIGIDIVKVGYNTYDWLCNNKVVKCLGVIGEQLDKTAENITKVGDVINKIFS